MKYYTGSFIFPFQWDQVVTGFWQKYSLSNSKHINSEDVLSRKIVEGKLFSKRLINKSAGSAQKVANMLFNKKAKRTWVIEESVVDPVEKTMVTYTRNIGLKELALIEEKCVYKANPEKTDEVIQMKSAWIDSSHAYLGRIIQNLVYQHFKRRAGKSSGELLGVLTKLYSMEVADPTNSSGIRPLLKDHDITGKAIRAGKSVAQKTPKL
ncbi:PRELI domain-containing protein 1, mitochondrial-like [Mizuhopecten yessoensis]|uniref:PRELI domain-containing protein 1, mitochondrial-like n=1 Tax=Mizuhopecten yessoensis TaxID=6573 RepID=UPI000B45C178|nr:PRELI domain-containing protein 1, mitochondrial-like [Mizuhopecten yessoensis]